MNKSGIAAFGLLALTSLFTTAAMAEVKKVDFKSCTKDGQTVVFHQNVDESLMNDDTAAAMQSAADKTARERTSDEIGDSMGTSISFFINYIAAVQAAQQDGKKPNLTALSGADYPTVEGPGCSITPAP